MRKVDTYFVKLENGTTAWLSVGQEPVGEVLEVRSMLIADEGMELLNIKTSERADSVWVKGDEADWIEVKKPEEYDE